MKNILIVGGGIAGLALARLLQQQSNHAIHLIEKQQSWQISGAGLYTPANGVRALDQMGLGQKAQAKGFVINTRDLMDREGKMVLKLDLENIWGRPKPCLGISRQTLHELLLAEFGDENINMGTTVERMEPSSDLIQVSLSNGHTANYDLVIGADGLYSKIRQAVLGEKPIRTVTEQVCRFIIKRPPSIQSWSLFMSGDGQFLIIPISEKKAYCYVNNKKAVGGSKAQYMDPFLKFAEPVKTALEQWDPEQAFWDDLQELAPLEQYGKGRVVLIGDAAHGMPPFMAQGGSLALEDALVLDKLVKDSTDWSQMASAFTLLRKDRIDWTRVRNRKREKLSKLPYWIAKIGLKWKGKQNWTEDYKPLAKEYI